MKIFTSLTNWKPFFRHFDYLASHRVAEVINRHHRFLSPFWTSYIMHFWKNEKMIRMHAPKLFQGSFHTTHTHTHTKETQNDRSQWSTDIAIFHNYTNLSNFYSSIFQNKVTENCSKIKPTCCPPGPQSLGQLPPATRPTSGIKRKSLIRTNIYTVGNCPGGDQSRWLWCR